MRAVIINQYGPASELHVADVPRPEPDTDEILIQVRAAGINPVDTKARAGDLAPMPLGSFPKILGGECAGVVEAVGLMVTDFQPGDRVVVSLASLTGGYAEYTVAKAKNAVKLPDSVDFVQAGAMVVAAGTALQGMRDKGHLRPNDRVLINGAGGGVGTFAVQLAKIMGAQVTAVCGPDSVAMVRELGADTVIDYSTTDFTQRPDKYELVFDAVGKSSFDACKPVLTDEGVYVTTMPGAKQVLESVVTIFTKQKSELIMFSFTQEDQNWLLKHVTEGRLRTVIDRTYSLDQLVEAHEYSEAGHVKGKLVVTM